MIYSIAEIDAIWLGRTAKVDVIYLCDDKSMFKGLFDGTLQRLFGGIDDYNVELKKQQAEDAQIDIDYHVIVDNLVTTVNTLLVKTEIKQVEVDFGALPKSSLLWGVNDVDVIETSKIIPSIAYDKPTGKDLDELRLEGINVIAGNVSLGRFELFITPINGGTLSDRFKINYIIN